MIKGGRGANPPVAFYHIVFHGFISQNQLPFHSSESLYDPGERSLRAAASIIRRPIPRNSVRPRHPTIPGDFNPVIPKNRGAGLNLSAMMVNFAKSL